MGTPCALDPGFRDSILTFHRRMVGLAKSMALSDSDLKPVLCSGLLDNVVAGLAAIGSHLQNSLLYETAGLSRSRYFHPTFVPSVTAYQDT